MAWFGGSLSSITGHLQNLTKEVLSESSDETKAAADNLKVTTEKLEELEAICTAQDLEISALKKQNAELRRRLEAVGGLENESQIIVPSAPATWLSIEQRCDAGYAAGAQTRGGKGHTRALSDATSVASKHQERLEKELKDRLHVIEHLELQLRKVEEERHVLSLRNSEQEKQIQQLTTEVSVDKHVENRNTLSLTQKEELLIQENNELRTMLNDANRRTKEMEEEIISMRNQCLDQVIDSQVSTSEFRLDVEQTRKRITNETGVQRAERLRAHQDMVNRMIQMGEKTRETEQNVKRLQNEDKHLAAEMVSKIQKLGDQEQQELVHGTLKALELENQVLNMRNVQLEREATKDTDMKSDIQKAYADGVDLRNRNEAVKSEDDLDNLSLQSELSDFTLHSQRLENQIAQLQTQVEIYKKEVKHNEMVRVDLSNENSALEEQVMHLKELLKEKQKADHTRLTESALTQTESLSHLDDEASWSTEDKLKEIEEELERSKESMKLLHEEKQCFEQELEAMARIVQDLESKIAVGEEEKQTLITSMEELDQQHQDALDKLLGLRNCDQVENENLKIQVKELQHAVSCKPQMDEIGVQTEYFPVPLTENVTQTECIHFTDRENQISPSCHTQETSTDSIENKIMNDASNEVSFKYDAELCESIRKFINFDIPNDFNNTIPQSLYLVQEIVKFANECKWKKDTLERKVAELIRENNECKSTITILEAECSNLKDNVERLAEQLVGVAKSGKDPLPTILENCEEMEIMEQKNAMLEEEVTVLKETRVNLEENAARMREERQELLSRIRNFEAGLRNQENLETERERLSEQTVAYKLALEDSEHGRVTAEAQAQSLMHEIENFAAAHEEELKAVNEKAKAVDLKNDELLQVVISKETDLKDFQKKLADSESEKNLLALHLQEKGQHLEEVQVKLSKITKERDSLQSLTSDLQKQRHHYEEISKKLAEVSQELEESTQAKLKVEEELQIAQTFIRNSIEKLDAETTKWKNIVTSEETKTKNALLSVFNLQQENKTLQDKLHHAEQCFKSLSVLKEQQEKELEEIEKKFESKIVQSVSSSLSCDSLQGLKHEVAQLISEKNKLQQTEASAHLEQVHVSKQIESLKSQIIQKENIETQLNSEVSRLKVKIADDAELQNKYKTEVTDTIQKLDKENKALRDIITAMDSNKIDSMQQIEKLETWLHAALEEKDKLIRENSDLKTAILKKYSSQEVGKNHFLENESCALVRDSDHEVTATTHKSDKETINKDLTLLSNIQGLFTERVNTEISEAEQLREENHKVLLLLEGKAKEVEVLQCKLDSVASVMEENQETIRRLQEEKESITKEKFQNQEKFEMTKETISKLSEMIKEKDHHIHELKDQVSQLNMRVCNAESANQQLLLSQEAATQAIQEHDQLLQTVHIKHQESVQYHAEIQRLSALLSQELAKNQQLASQYEVLVQKCNEETNRSPQHLQDVKDLQNLIKMKDEGLQQLCSRLELKQQELHARGMEMETLQHQIELLTYERATQQAVPNIAAQQDEDARAKYDELFSKFQDEQKKYKQLQNELEVSQGKELSLQRELERLRIHLVEIEDTYTQEALKTEGHIKELVNKLQQSEEMMKSSSTVYKSANIRANQQVETLQEQARLIAQQRDDVQAKLSIAEDQVAKHSAALCNLQAVLEQFQRDREREINAARSSVYVKVEAAGRKHNELLEEISSLKLQLKEAKEGLSAASRLGEELERKAALVMRLKQEAVQLEEKLQKAEHAAKAVGQSMEGKVDKCLVKNVILGFFLAPSNSKDQVLHVVASVLDFSEDEKSKIQKTLGLRGADGSGSWFKSLLHPAGQDNSNLQSLSEAFVRFLESESIPQPKLKMLPPAEKQASSSTNSPRTTPVNPQRKSPLLLADVQLPTFAQFPVGRNSSSILKDILKES